MQDLHNYLCLTGTRSIMLTWKRKQNTFGKRLKAVLNQHSIDHHMNRVGSMLSIFFTDEVVTDFNTANTTDQDFFRQFFHEMLKRGIYLPPSPFESWFLATTHTNEMLDQTIAAADEALGVRLIPGS
jgi:glutamate-1-semialdehyde 2,1-aminomutase